MASEKRMIPLQKRIIYGGDVFNSLMVEKGWSATEAADFVKVFNVIDAVEVVHGHKVVRNRCRGIAYAMECPICLSKIPSNKPFQENVEYCSVCRKKLDDTFQNYCPNCGAKMDGDGDGNL